MEIAARHRVPLLPRGGGSSLAGQCVGPGLVIDTTKYMDRILAVDEEANTVTVQAGLPIGVLNRTLAPLGPDAGTGSRQRRSRLGRRLNRQQRHRQPQHPVRHDGRQSSGNERRPQRWLHRTLRGPSPRQSWKFLAAVTRCRRKSTAKSLGSYAPNSSRFWNAGPATGAGVSGYNLDRLLHALLQGGATAAGDGRDTVNAALLRDRLGFDSLFRSEFCDAAQIDQFNLSQLLAGSEGTLATVTSANSETGPQAQR